MADAIEAEPVMVKIRTHPHEKAVYVEALMHVDGNQLLLVKHGGPTEIIALAHDRVISTAFKHSHFYVVVHSGSIAIKMKLSSPQMQSRWLEALQVKISELASSEEQRVMALAARQDARQDASRRNTMLLLSPQSPKSIEVRPSLQVDDAEDGLMTMLQQNCSFASSETSATRSSFSAIFPATPPAVPPRPSYTYSRRDVVKSGHRHFNPGSSASAVRQQQAAARPSHEFPFETTVSPEGRVTSSV